MAFFAPDLVRSGTEILVLSALTEGPLYGYVILKRLKEGSDGRLRLSAGTLYPILHKLEVAGAVRATWQEGTTRKRKYYELTAKGRRLLRRKADEWRDFAGMVDRVTRPALEGL